MGNIYRVLLQTRLEGDMESFTELKECCKINDSEFSNWVVKNLDVAARIINDKKLSLVIPDEYIPQVMDYGKKVLKQLSEEEYNRIRCLELQYKQSHVAKVILFKLNFLTNYKYEDFSHYNLVKFYLDFAEAFDDLQCMINGIMEGVL